MKKILLPIVAGLLSIPALIGTISKTNCIRALDYAPDSLFKTSSASFLANNVSYPDFVTKESSSRGLLFDLEGNGGEIKFHNVIDLNKVEGNLIEFLPNIIFDGEKSSQKDISMTKVYVTLTDAYDDTKSISIAIEQNGDYLIPEVDPIRQTQSAMVVWYNVNYNGITSWITNEPACTMGFISWCQSLFHPNYYTRTNDLSVNPNKDYFVRGTSVFELVENPIDSEISNYFELTPYNRTPIAFKYNNFENQVLTRVYENDEKESLVLDLDDPTDDTLDFEGFTTGEVYVSIKTDAKRGSILVNKIGNYDLSNITNDYFDDNTGNVLIKNYDFVNPITGSIGYSYPLPDIYSNNNSAQLKIVDSNQNTVFNSKKDTNFIPTTAGLYKMSIDSINEFGNVLTQSSDINILEHPAKITDLSRIDDLKIKMFEKTKVPLFSYTDNTNELSKEITLHLNNETIPLTEDGYFTIEDKYSQVYISVKVSTGYGYFENFIYPINLDTNVVVFQLIDCFDEMAVNKGLTFTIPQYKAIDYSLNDTSKNNFDVDIECGLTKTYMPGDKIEINSGVSFSFYRADKNPKELLKVLNVKCTPNNISTTDNNSTLDKHFSFPNTVKNFNYTSIGSELVLANGISSFDYPYVLSTTDLNISFAVFPKLTHYDSLDITVTSFEGYSLNFSISDFSDKPILMLNGTRIFKKITVEKDTYLSLDNPRFTNLDYYLYSFKIDDSISSITTKNGIKIADITTWNNGNEFSGFKKGACKVNFSINNAHESDSFVMSTISNQGLSFVQLNYGDKSAPQLAFDGVLKSTMVRLGDRFIVPKAYVYDALNSYATVSMNVTFNSQDESRTELLFSSQTPESCEISFDEYGSYVVSYRVSDSNVTALKNYILEVNNDSNIEINLNGEYKAEYSGSVKIIGASLVDSIDKNPTLVITIIAPTAEFHNVNANEKFELKFKGEYVIRYYAINKYGNYGLKLVTFLSK